MKRSRLGPGRKSLERGSSFKKRTVELRRKAGGQNEKSQRALEWKARARGRQCEYCHRPAVDGHHLLPKQYLKRWGADLWDLRNYAAVCRACHDGHHSVWAPLPLPGVAHPVWTFAREIGPAAERYLLKHYAWPESRFRAV